MSINVFLRSAKETTPIVQNVGKKINPFFIDVGGDTKAGKAIQTLFHLDVCDPGLFFLIYIYSTIRVYLDLLTLLVSSQSAGILGSR